MRSAIIVHGGAWDIPDEKVKAHQEGCVAALKVGWRILSTRGYATDAVQYAVIEMEDNPIFDAGYGSFLNAVGEIELDASIMDGSNLNAGAVAAVQNIKNPIKLARKIMDESEHIMLVGNGANQFAALHGLESCEPQDLLYGPELERYYELKKNKQFKTHFIFENQKHMGTVGAVAIDKYGNLASATSTGVLQRNYLEE